jgi:tripartite-type tricarboxylate transporter receptor subunit TctC
MRTPMNSIRRGMLAAGAALIATPFGRTWAAGDIAGGKPITLVVSYPAGGGADVMARLIAPRLAETLGQPVVVDNKPGASGTIAAAQVARATPDGATLLLDASSFAVNPALFDKLPYDSGLRLRPAGGAGAVPERAGLHGELRGPRAGRRAAPGRAKPGTLAYASSGNGSAQHLAGALFEAWPRST